jgi:putative nucleotidyltransferase with HDIG domain
MQDAAELPSIFRENNKAKNVLILPIMFGHSHYGALILNFGSSEIDSLDDEIVQARQSANQLAVALSNSRLYSELEKLSIGTVEALARTVDAKSKWTAGHSERVAELAVKIAQVMGFNKDELDKLFRAGLLHDIGKIGIPIKLLDKPGKLTDDEYDHIKTHPAIGGKILEPIEVYKDIIPLIVQHHERYDGKGYPQGLAGKEIHPAARILCAADVYDALISQRPYRDGWVKDKAIAFIRENSGVMFDPEVANVLLALEV